jgi:hypothetical protein
MGNGANVKFERSEVLDPPAGASGAASSRYRYSTLFGDRVKWLHPHHLVPSFASADGQAVVYRRRSQVMLTETADNSGVTPPTSFGLGGGVKVRIDEFGYARVVRPARPQQLFDPLNDLADGATEAEREAAHAICEHLNQHVEAIGHPQRWTPSPKVQLVPLVGRPFMEQPPAAPQPPADSKDLRLPSNVVNDYLDARAGWLRRRFAWENTQAAAKERSRRAAAGDHDAMREHLRACLGDILWPMPTLISFSFVGSDELRLDVRVPGMEALPDRAAAITYGNRVAVKPMLPVKRNILHNRHALGLVLRLFGEAFAALPSVTRCTISALQAPAGQQPRYIVSAATERGLWSRLHAENWVTDDAQERALKVLQARYSLTGLGAFLPISPLG